VRQAVGVASLAIHLHGLAERGERLLDAALPKLEVRDSIERGRQIRGMECAVLLDGLRGRPAEVRERGVVVAQVDVHRADGVEQE